MLGRKKNDADAAVQDAPSSTMTAADVGQEPDEGKKGRPTPKRREAEAKNRRPLVQNDRKAAARENRVKASEARAKMNEAMVTGDDRYLPARDKGPVRRYIRDYIDARWNLGEFFLPVSLAVVLVILFLGNRPELAIYVILGLYAVVLIAVVDAVITASIMKRKLVAKFGVGKIPRGSVLYAVMRAFQIRRTRMPKPQVKRGEYPS
ncbi:putative integral membrane protein [Beutenbergia cavernae DSM 12333]|uniref:Putative integral membrane protein n=1 Tax=Beutenbergia cavernae (strain ATCC BAA-8 / DSM 12333 / CCUG 43141 / JCM 11478 / NBRC 16432 / NCIMB 13614 / HKI 0122) TaxID=471853 RepID=C5C508_BEUC1|nr:DUF3043 domain-containing protein [Beutenbergia cavernae]ACQ80136.1 putative integral membrane protein [Beutenbergia cavernae DSM 12333]